MEKSYNYKKVDAGCNKWGKERLDLAIYIRDNILTKISNEWFIENGTLLGAWRNGKFIAHDDDFDIAMLINTESEITNILKKIELLLLSSKYKARLVKTYASKIEIYDESFGKFILPVEKYNGSDFHYVTLDIQFYLKKNDIYECLYFVEPHKRLLNEEILKPSSKIILENEEFNAPNNIEKFLINNYGNLNINAKYNQNTGLYE